MALFSETEQALDDLKLLDPETLEAPPERMTSPSALRAIFKKLEEDDTKGAANRALIQGLMDFIPPHDEEEMENKGQSDRFNITTGEGPAIKNEAVSAYMDIYTNPKTLAEIPLTKDVDQNYADTWSQIMAEEFTSMDRSDDKSLPLHLQLGDVYVTHGVAVAFFDDKQTMQYSVAGLDKFKFPRTTGITSSGVEIAVASGVMTVTDLYGKIGSGALDGWNERAVKRAITDTASKKNNRDWSDWEGIQRDIKANEMFVSTVCNPVDVIFGWIKEFNGKISFYIATKNGCDLGNEGAEDEFLFRQRDFYDSADQAFQIFPFGTGNGGMLYTVRGLGYLIYQLCTAMDVMHCKLLDNARIGSSLIVQPASTEDLQDLQLIDAGGFISIPPTMKIPERQMSQNLNNSLIPAIEESRRILNRATGGLASGNMMMNPEQDRRTKLEVSSQLDYINKLNSFAINLFYGPYDKIMREKVRRAFTVRQKDKQAQKRVTEMKARCLARGVPEEVFAKIDFKRVKANRIIGTGSRASRIMLLDQVQQLYSTFDAVGRSNFEYDYLVELLGVDKAERYTGKPNETRLPYDFKIAQLENMELLEGDYVAPTDGENHMVHLSAHVEPLQAGLEGVDRGEVDLIEWTMRHQMLYKHCVDTLEITVVHETVQPELNQYHQLVQQIGEIVVNGMKAIQKKVREGEMEDPQGQQGEASEEDRALQAKEKEMQMKLQEKDMLHKQKLQQMMEAHMVKLEMIKQTGAQAQVQAAQKAMSTIIARDAETKAKMTRLKASQI
jgi:hypothetical protein